MNGVLIFLSVVVCALIIFGVPPLVAPYGPDYAITFFDASKAVLLCGGLAAFAAFFASKQGSNGPFLLKIFVTGLLLRMLLGSVIFGFRAQDFFGGDALTYDAVGLAQLGAWGGDRFQQLLVNRFIGQADASGWGMVYLVAVVYGFIGRNMLAIQFINAVVGAVTAPVIFLCAQHVFNNSRVSRLAALAVAFYPSLVLWSSQGLKDAPIVFFLSVAIFATLKLGDKLSLKYVLVLIFSLFAVLSLRFYVFYMISVAVAGAFIIGTKALTPTGFVRQFLLIILVGLGLTYMGVTRYANVQLENYGNLERIQRSREDAANRGQSGFGKDVDVSTTSGAITSIPLGLVYLLFAPFPWQLTSLRQSITLPEMLVWWASFPMLILGLWFAIKHRLRAISPILIFTVMLSLAYSLFQGNVGTAYRQRAQLLVFYFIFVAVGIVLMLEKREEKKRRETEDKKTLLSGRLGNAPAPGRLDFTG